MTLRARVFIAVTLGVLVILVVSLLFLYGKRDQNNPSDQVKSGNNVSQNNNAQNFGGIQPTTIPAGVQVREASAAELQESGIIQLARTFVERYNTYSSDASYQNIRDVESIVTSDYWAKISAPLTKAQDEKTSFIGATTVSISVVNSKFESNSATVTIRAAKTVQKDGALSSSYYDYTVSLIKRSSNWLVNNQVEKKSS